MLVFLIHSRLKFFEEKHSRLKFFLFKKTLASNRLKYSYEDERKYFYVGAIPCGCPDYVDTQKSFHITFLIKLSRNPIFKKNRISEKNVKRLLPTYLCRGNPLWLPDYVGCTPLWLPFIDF